MKKQKVAIITNNIHCERHVQYFSTVEKYFIMNGWEATNNFNVNKIVICGCGFHEAMYEKVLKSLEEIRETDFLEKNIIIMACLPKTYEEDLKKDFKGEVIPFKEEDLLDNIIKAKIPFKDVELVNKFSVNEKCLAVDEEDDNFYIKISQGCLKECTFCIINKAKGYITSIPKEKILAQVKKAVQEGRKKIMLMGEDTFAYGIDTKGEINIIDLLEYLKSNEPSIELNFGYLHIRWLQKYSKEILDLCKKGIITELHIGLQHVNDDILKSMGRPAVFSELYKTLKLIKEECPDFYFDVDIMVGFPGETKEHFEELVQFFINDKCFNKVKHFGYSDVKGSVSSNFENKLSQDEIAYRWSYLDKILGSRSYSEETNESRLHDETFKLTRYNDYSFCVNTFNEDIDKKYLNKEIVNVEPVTSKDKGEFDFEL